MISCAEQSLWKIHKGSNTDKVLTSLTHVLAFLCSSLYKAMISINVDQYRIMFHLFGTILYLIYWNERYGDFHKFSV